MLIELENLTVTYGRRKALDGVSVAMESKALGLLGPNGAGKSTLIRAMLSLTAIASGKARLAGLDVEREGQRIRELIGYMPEHESHLVGMTVVRFLRFMGEMCGLPGAAALERAHEVLFYVGLGEVRYRKVETLSYGMLQKVRLAQALIHGPRILILDEPTNGLDPEARDEMLSLIREMVQRSEARIIISSHLLKDIETCCEEVIVLKKGRLAASGNIERMRQVEQNVYEVRVKGDQDRFIAALSERNCLCHLSERDALQVTTPEGFDPRTMFEIAEAHQVQIRHFFARRDSLEDVFIKILEEEETVAHASL